MMHTMRSTAPALLVLAAALAACGGPGGPAAQAPAAPEGDWILAEGTGPDGAVPIVDGSPITLMIDDGDWGGTAACNSYGGTVTVDGSSVAVSELYQTEMACLDDRVMESERRYLDALAQVDRFERDGDRLVLRGEDVTLTFAQAEPVPDAAVLGTDWSLTALVLGAAPDGAVSSVLGDPTLRFDADGSVQGETGCNAFSGPYELTDDAVRIDDLALTKIGCDGALLEQEQAILHVLEGDMDVAVDGDSLTLTAPDGRALAFRAAPTG
jgi:heat shock protein HslJ